MTSGAPSYIISGSDVTGITDGAGTPYIIGGAGVIGITGGAGVPYIVGVVTTPLVPYIIGLNIFYLNTFISTFNK